MSKQCPKCGDVYPDYAWKNRKSIRGVSYICPGCETKHHWRDLKDYKKGDD